jgi:hypothetical protein
VANYLIGRMAAQMLLGLTRSPRAPEGWHRQEVMEPYRLALLRGISTGHSMRRASATKS